MAAFNYCLEEGGLTIDEIDCVAYYEDWPLDDYNLFGSGGAAPSWFQ